MIDKQTRNMRRWNVLTTKGNNPLDNEKIQKQSQELTLGEREWLKELEDKIFG